MNEHQAAMAEGITDLELIEFARHLEWLLEKRPDLSRNRATLEVYMSEVAAELRNRGWESMDNIISADR